MRGVPYVFSNFDAGVNLEAAPYSLDIGQARQGFNVHTSPAGAIVKRNGCEAIAEPEVLLTSLFGVNLGTDIFIGAGGTKLYSISTTGTVKTLKTGLTSNLPWEFVQAPISGTQGPIYGVNGTDKPISWDGTSGEVKEWTASEGSIPNGTIITYHENRIYIAKGSTVYWSDITDPRNFESPKGGSTKVDPEDGEDITAFGKVGPYLILFKERKTFLLTDTNTGAYRRVSDDMGCISPRSVVSTEAGTFFITPDSEVVITDGQSFDNKVSIPINPLLKNLRGAIAKKACGIHVEDYVYLSISENGSINDTILEFNLTTGAWWIHKIQLEEKEESGINQFVLLDPSNITTLYGVGGTTKNNAIFKMFVDDKYSDFDSLAYKAYWISPWHVFTYPHIRKRMREIRVDALGNYDLYTATSFSTAYVKESPTNWEVADEGTIFGGTGTFGGEGTFGDTASIVEKRFYTPGEGRAWSLKFESNDVQALQIYAYTCAINYKKD